MYRRSKTVLVCLWSIAFLVCAAGAVVISRNLAVSAGQTLPQTRPVGNVRNLSLQPEAFKLSRQLGSRFMPSRQLTSLLTGTLTVGNVQQNVAVTRRPTNSGEDIQVAIAGEPAQLAWSDDDDSTARGPVLSEAHQILLERLALDNPDQFVLAQLHGASYYTIAHNVRADAGGSDNYDGPLWDVVRVDEPQSKPGRPRSSNSRLYYINTQTGLIDKIVSELKGETIEANILEWTEQAGEKLPSHIIWKRGNETVQEFRMTSVSLQPQQ